MHRVRRRKKNNMQQVSNKSASNKFHGEKINIQYVLRRRNQHTNIFTNKKSNMKNVSQIKILKQNKFHERRK